MATPKWLKELDDFLRPAYKAAYKTAKEVLEETLDTAQIALIRKYYPNFDKSEEYRKEIKELQKETTRQEIILEKLVKVLVKQQVEIPDDLRAEIIEALED